MRLSFSLLWQLTKQSVNAWIEDRATSMGAALAYYTAFSLAPLLLIVITVAGLVFGQEAAQGAIVAQVGGLVGQQSAEVIEVMVRGASDTGSGIVSTIIGIVVLLIGATTVFAELQEDLDLIWKAPPRKSKGILGLVRARLLSFGLILAIGFLMIVSLIVSSVLVAVSDLWSGAFGDKHAFLQAVNFIVSFAVITVLFAMIYKFLPRVPIAWNDVWIGAAVTSFLFAIGKFLIGFYIGTSAISSSYGAAGAFVALLVWIYFSTQVFLLGAEFTHAYAKAHGSRSGVEKSDRDTASPSLR